MSTIWLPLAKCDDKPALRHFGIGVSILISGVLGTLLALWYDGAVSLPLVMLGGVILLIALTLPLALYWPYRGWMVVASLLNFVNTRLILGLAFFGLILPVGLLMRMIGKLGYPRCPEAKTGSYWQSRQSSPDASNLKEPF